MKYLFLITVFCGLYLSGKSQIPVSELIDSSFYMPVEDKFLFQTEGLVVTGKISTGKVAVGQRINIMGITGVATVATVTAIYKNGNSINSAVAGEEIGLLVPEVNPDDVTRGMVAIETNFGKIDTFINAEIEVLANGRAYTDGNIVNIYVNGIDIPGCEIIMEPGTTLEPGEKRTVKLLCPVYVAQIKGLPFWIRQIHPYKVTASCRVIMDE